MTRTLLPLAVAFTLSHGSAFTHPAGASGQERPDRWRGQAELGFNGAAGNRTFYVLRTGGRARWLQTDKLEFEASLLVRYGKSAGQVIADDARASLKSDLRPKETWSPFVFADWSRDRIRRLDTRFSGGAGAKLTLWQRGSGSGSVSAAALYDYQNFGAVRDRPTPPSESLARFSGRTKLDHKLSASTSIQHVAFFQPVWNDLGDYVLDVTHSVSTQILSRLSLGVEHQLLRDAEPPPGVEPTDHRFSVVLQFTF